MDIKREIVPFVQEIFHTSEFIPLHEPKFIGNEKHYVLDAIESTFVSSVGQYVNDFEEKIKTYTKSSSVVVTSSGSNALHAALYLAGVGKDQFVITPSLTFVSACNCIKQLGAEPIFADINYETLGLCPKSVESFLTEHASINKSGKCIHKNSGRVISAILPMHTFGHPVDLSGLVALANKWNLTLVEDAAESLGSLYKGNHTGTYGRFGIISFNGNKIMTTGGGGAILSKVTDDGNRVRHITSTARVNHAYEVAHDEYGFNYRMPNINAALGCAQIEKIDQFVQLKRALALQYERFFDGSECQFFKEPKECRSNYWLNAILCHDRDHQQSLLNITNDLGVMTRPPWNPMHTLPMYNECMRTDLSITQDVYHRLVNLPSSVTLAA